MLFCCVIRVAIHSYPKGIVASVIGTNPNLMMLKIMMLMSAATYGDPLCARYGLSMFGHFEKGLAYGKHFISGAITSFNSHNIPLSVLTVSFTNTAN